MKNGVNYSNMTIPEAVLKEIFPRHCKVCGKEFVRTTNKKTCSPVCSLIYRRQEDCKRPKRRNADDWRETILNELGRVCANCESDEDLEIDHKVPIIEGGENRLVNLQVLCHDCHQLKHRGLAKGFRRRLEPNGDITYVSTPQVVGSSS